MFIIYLFYHNKSIEFIYIIILYTKCHVKYILFYVTNCYFYTLSDWFQKMMETIIIILSFLGMLLQFFNPKYTTKYDPLST